MKYFLFPKGVALVGIISVHLLTFAMTAYGQDVLKEKLSSKILDQDREIGILLPKNYDKDSKKKYPVMYMLDSSGTIAPAAAELSSRELVPEMILVGIRPAKETRDIDLLPSYMRSNLDVENSPNGRADKFLKFIEKELMPYMKKHYKVSGVNALSGHSRSGVFVLYSLLSKPKLFDARFAFSPAVWREDGLIIKKTRDFLASTDRGRSFFYLSMGSTEVDKMKTAFDELTNALKKTRNEKLEVVSEYTNDATHQTNVELSISSALKQWAEYLSELR